MIKTLDGLHQWLKSILLSVEDTMKVHLSPKENKREILQMIQWMTLQVKKVHQAEILKNTK